MAERTGVRLGPGGPHVGQGTRNWLGRLGPSSYLELIGPDPDQPAPASPRPFGVDDLAEPTVVAWCIRRDDLDALGPLGARAGVAFGAPFTMEREAPNGTLRWRLSLPDGDPAAGLVPFFIDWMDSTHPATTSVDGLRVTELFGEHPDRPRVGAMLRALDVELEVRDGAVAGLHVTLAGPDGEINW
ncbi:MAG: VOC family protein [Desertimonas sp.]